MPTTPQQPVLPDNNAVVDFRAPPPSPVASGRRSSVANDAVITDFLEHSLRVPDLILPDKVFPKHKTLESPPKLDFQWLASFDQFHDNPDVVRILDSVAKIGCFEIVNHGISGDAIESALSSAARVFRVSPDKKAELMRSSDRLYGFEEDQGVDESSQEFVWCRDEKLKSEMEGIWPLGHSNFSETMETISSNIEDLGGKIMRILQQFSTAAGEIETVLEEPGGFGGSILCYLHKHCPIENGVDDSGNSLKYEVIRTLIRGSEFPHDLCVHVCSRSEEFHVYSKKGWVSFRPDKDTLIVTLGDKLQARSNGRFKHVIGRPVFFKGGEDENFISMAFLYSSSPTPNFSSSETDRREEVVSLGQQVIIAIASTLVYQLFVYIFKIL